MLTARYACKGRIQYCAVLTNLPTSNSLIASTTRINACACMAGKSQLRDMMSHQHYRCVHTTDNMLELAIPEFHACIMSFHTTHGCVVTRREQKSKRGRQAARTAQVKVCLRTQFLVGQGSLQYCMCRGDLCSAVLCSSKQGNQLG